MKYNLREANYSDYEFCYKITKENMFDLFCRHWGGWSDAEFDKGFKINNIKIIEFNYDSIGFFDYEFTVRYIHINNIQISKSMQGQGFGTNVLNNFLHIHRNKRIILTVFSDNPARKLYERMGFREYKRDGGAIKMEVHAQQADALEPLTRPGDP